MISPSAGIDHPRLDDDDVALLEVGRGDLLEVAVAATAQRRRRRARRAQRVRLRLAAALGDRLGEVREQDGQPEPDRDHADEPELPVFPCDEILEEDARS